MQYYWLIYNPYSIMKPNEYESESGMCPYCGSEDVQVLCDGTCRCLECGSIWK
jgi:hypothetical protein